MFFINNPYNSVLLSQHQYITGEEANALVDLSANSYPAWRAKSMPDRLNFIKRLVNVLTNNQHLLANQCTLEMGKPISQSLAEVQKCKKICEYYIENAEIFLSPEKIDTDGSQSYVVYEPLGVILGVMPWNFPYWQVFRFAIPTIIAGNTVLLKHASNVAGCALLIEELFIEAGFPDGVYKNLLVSGDMVKDIIEHPAVKAVSLTGSEKAGASVAAIAAGKIKKAVLELGGSNAFIVCKDANLDEVIPVAVNARFQNAGQSCIAAKRFFVHSSLFDVFVNKLTDAVKELKTGDPLEEDVYLGPLARVDLAKDVEDQVNRSVAMGAKIIYGGQRKEAFYEPTILTEVTSSMPIFTEEVFGPAVPVMPFETFEEAVDLSNDTPFGLGVSVFTANVEGVKNKLQLFEEGAVFINAMVKSDPALPFGGVKRSGYGRELAENGIKEFVNVKTVYVG